MKKLLMLLVVSIGVFLCGCELDISVEPSSSASSSSSDEIILGENDKLNKVKMVFRGYMDYKRGITGKYKER